MAQIDIGKIKMVWKGAWNSATAYTVDDVVSLSGSSYICIQAGTNQNPSTATAYWEKMSDKGTDADLINITGTTGGDMYYNSGSAIARLAKGTAGQALVMNAGATAPEWGSGGKLVEVHAFSDDNTGTISSTGDFVSWNFTPTISGKVFLSHTGAHRGQSGSHFYCRYYFNNGSGEVIQAERGFGYPPSNHSHNQGWSHSFIPLTGGDADSTTPMTVTANTQCNFRVNNNSGDGSNAAGDGGKDHIVSAIIFES